MGSSTRIKCNDKSIFSAEICVWLGCTRSQLFLLNYCPVVYKKVNSGKSHHYISKGGKVSIFESME